MLGVEIDNDNLHGKIRKGLKKINRTKHKKKKDNAKRDFIDGKWIKCKFDENNRITEAIDECVQYLETVIK